MGTAPLTVNFDGSLSSDNKKIVSYHWFFGNYDAGDPDQYAVGSRAAHVYHDPGTYYVRLAITDDEGNVAICYQDISVAESSSEGSQSFRPLLSSLSGPLESTILATDFVLEKPLSPSALANRDYRRRLRAAREQKNKSGCHRVKGQQYCYGNPHYDNFTRLRVGKN